MMNLYNVLWVYFSKLANLVPNLTHFEFFLKYPFLFQSEGALPQTYHMTYFKVFETCSIDRRKNVTLALALVSA